MKITDRDVEVLRFINENGFCLRPHLERRFLIKNWSVYKLLGRLIDRGLVKREKIFWGKPDIFLLTNEGAEFTELPPISKISWGGYEHQVLLTDLIIKLLEKFPQVDWISERKLKHGNFFNGLGVRGHISDGILCFSEEEKISIELELTLKSKQRLDGILKTYGGQLALKEVWYFCSKQVLPTMRRICTNKPYVKVHSLTGILNDSE